MAKISSEGIEIVERELQNIDKNLRSTCMREMLEAGADVLVESWRNSIQAHGHVRTGTMMNNVGKTEVQMEPDGMSIAVYPQGTDSHRVTNAQKAYILHYGRQANKNGRKEIKGDKFVTEAEQNAKRKVDAAMQAILDRYVSGKE